MISKKYSQTLFMIFMSFGMSVIMSGVVTAVNTGIGDVFLERYFNSWLFAFPVALFAAFTMAPIMRPLVNKIASKD
jgi:amino acid permease